MNGHAYWRKKDSIMDEEADTTEDSLIDNIQSIEIQHTLDVLREFDADSVNLDLVHCRLKCITGLEQFKKVQEICFRQNSLKQIENLECVCGTLIHLEFYDNLLTKIENLSDLKLLQYLDLSFNNISTIESLEELIQLTSLYFVNNNIHKICHLSTLTNLTVLELGSNFIREIEGLDTLVNLEELYLGKNKLKQLKNLDSLKKLRILVLSSNKLTKLEGLSALTSLRELYISGNGIKKIENLNDNTKLEVLDLSCNFINTIENIEPLAQSLLEFWLNDNKISNWDNLNIFKNFQHLSTIYLERNPLAQDVATYRRRIKILLPTLKQLDATCLH